MKWIGFAAITVCGFAVIWAAATVLTAAFLLWRYPPRKIFEKLRRRPDFCPLDDVPSAVQQLVLMSEDPRFYTHHGVDKRAVKNALIYDIRTFHAKGASTISQQLIKNMYFSFRKSLFRKCAELWMTLWLERKFTKREILESYLNLVYFGSDRYGITAAARYYYDSVPSEMTGEQTYLLLVLLRAPNDYSPILSPDACRKAILKTAYEFFFWGWIDERQYQAVQSYYTGELLQSLAARHQNEPTERKVILKNRLAQHLRKEKNTVESDRYYKHITAKPRPIRQDIQQLIQYKQLVWVLTKRTFQVRYRQTVGGWLWMVIIPVFQSMVGFITFGSIAGLGTDGIPSAVFYLSGTALWNLFTLCLNKNAEIFRENANLFGKVYFPRLSVSVSYVLTAIFEFAVNMALVALLTAWYAWQGQIHIKAAWLICLPLIVLWIGVMGMGVGLLLSSLTTKYRDFSVALPFAISLWLPITPVMYPASAVTSVWVRRLFYLNPMTAPIEAFRSVLFGQGTVWSANLIWSMVFTVAICLCGMFSFHRVEHKFNDTI